MKKSQSNPSALLKQSQEFDGRRYYVPDLIIASKDLEPFAIKVSDIFLNYEAPNDNTLHSFIDHYKRTQSAEMKYPIILSPTNYILDGKHRLAKAIIEGREMIQVVRFDTMPDCGINIEE